MKWFSQGCDVSAPVPPSEARKGGGVVVGVGGEATSHFTASGERGKKREGPETLIRSFFRFSIQTII